MNSSKLYNKIMTYRDRDQSKLHLTPNYDWGIILFVSVAMILFLVFFTRYVLVDIYLSSFEEGTINQSVVVQYDIEGFRKELSTVIEYYEKKEKEHNNLLENPILFDVENWGDGGDRSSGEQEDSVSGRHDFPEGIKVIH
ncbi:hypothetical protein KJ973_00150 [Patescibacteria group bacterium]|nr:hypothetical protein [Patescibacteria group bacterium]MBU1246773.1 hypothetical protein [Patescibacteria group bacterium]MBU1519099.1 hypothetical protein [Patescibacteria group bacterium]MBU1730625.1 hypothetical protein [Patescibacteria group bacterium]MBU1956298.1 hypothetical protein [Patescibacteria group bacterium]